MLYTEINIICYGKDNFMKRLVAILLCIMTLLVFTACTVGTGNGTGNGQGNGGNNNDGGTTDEGGGNEGGGTEQYSVTLLISEGMSVTSQNPVKVNKGENATFTISLDKTYAIREIEGATYNPETKTITVENVTKATRISVVPVNVGYDTTVKYNYYYSGVKSGDTSSYRNGLSLNAGTIVTLESHNQDFAFMGWSLNDYLESGGQLLSLDKTYTFELTPEMQVYGNCNIFANYADLRDNIIYYHLNGGEIDPLASNLKSDKYLTVTYTPGSPSVKVTMSANYYQNVGTISAFWDDGAFYREGYVLKEFNTKPDGTGESFDPGSLYPMKSHGPMLYCIWAEDTAHSDFTYEAVHYGYASGVTATTAPHWKQDGIKITGYTGNAKEVVIPEMIGGKYVTAIAAGAFENKDMETLVLSRFLLNVADGAFVNCNKLETIYYPDSIYVISNASFDTASWANVKNFYVRATMAPRRMSGASDCGMYAIKLARFLANPDKNRITVVSGSSSFQGLSGGYLEALLGDEWCAVNFGTTRTTHIYLFLPVLGYYANENDIIIYAPENSIYEMGEPEFYWKTLRDAEGMYNIFRHIDISNYTNVISTFSDFNRGQNGSINRYTLAPQKYAQMMDNTNEWGEYDHANRHQYNVSSLYSKVYDIRLDNYFVSKADQGSNAQVAPADITDPLYKDIMNDVITRAKVNGAKVYFSFSPMADEAINAAAKAGGAAWYDAYEQMIKDNFVFDGVLGDAENYIFSVKYFYNNAFHPNDYGRVYRTYRVYIDVCEEILGIAEADRTDYYCGATLNSSYQLVDKDGKVLFRGCMFEENSDGTPLTPADI